MNRVYHSNRNIVYSCKYHIVFCPKYRRKVLVNGVAVRLKELIQSIAAENHFEVIEMEIMPDHVHLLLEVDPQFGIHKAVKTRLQYLKTYDKISTYIHRSQGRENVCITLVGYMKLTEIRVIL